MTMSEIVYGVTVFLSLADMILVLVAIRRATARQTVGRLVCLALLLSGLSLSAIQRLAQEADLTWGIALIVIGLLGLTVFLPARWRRRR